MPYINWNDDCFVLNDVLFIDMKKLEDATIAVWKYLSNATDQAYHQQMKNELDAFFLCFNGKESFNRMVRFPTNQFYILLSGGNVADHVNQLKHDFDEWKVESEGKSENTEKMDHLEQRIWLAIKELVDVLHECDVKDGIFNRRNFELYYGLIWGDDKNGRDMFLCFYVSII